MSDKNVPVPQGRYVPAKRRGDLIFTAGMTPRKEGKLLFAGKVKKDVPLETYREPARIAAENALNAAKSVLADGEKIGEILQATVFVNAEEGFLVHSKVADFVSEFFFEELGEGGVFARTAIGVAAIPADAPVEVQIICATGK